MVCATVRFKIGVGMNIKLVYNTREGNLKIQNPTFKDKLLESVVIIA